MSNTTKHTPGPWSAAHSEKTFGVVVCSKGHYVADAYSRSDDDGNNETEANARLIAAAPELLEALVQAKAEIIELLAGESCDHSVGICYCQTNNRLSMIEEAIKKAQP